MHYVLFLRDMRTPHMKMAVGLLKNMEQLTPLVERETVPEYSEQAIREILSPEGGSGEPVTWHKVFRKGGPLEWYLPPESEEEGILLALPDPTQARILADRLVKDAGDSLFDQAKVWHQYATQLENWQRHQDFKLSELV